MSQNQKNKPDAQPPTPQLRQEAEEFLRFTRQNIQAMPVEDVQRLVHELQVHQVELEIQNEELRKAQQALASARDRYGELYDFAPVGYLTLEHLDVIVEANLTATTILGVERTRLLGTKLTRFLSPADQAVFSRHSQAVRANGTTHTCELTIQRPDRRPLTVRLESMIVQGKNEQTAQCRTVLIDITERRRAETWLQSLIDTTQDAVISIDRQGRIVLFNPAAERLFGYSQAEVQGQRVNMLMPEPYRSEHDQYIVRYEQTGERRALGRIRAVAGQRKNGEVFPLELSVTEVEVGGNVRYAAFIRDISEKVRLQEQVLERERLSTIGTMAATLAHEIGNPLNGMAVATQLLQRRLDRYNEHLDEKVFAPVLALRSEIARLSQLLQEFRSLSRRQEYTFQLTSLILVVQEICTAEIAHYAQRGVSIEQDLPPSLPLVMVDGDKLKQVLLNLCKNAVEAMPDGGTLTLRAYDSGERVILEVADTGKGIPVGVDVFEPFVTTKPDGTGLGLPIVRQIVSAHDGTLTYTSEPEKGTIFMVALPLPSRRGNENRE